MKVRLMLLTAVLSSGVICLSGCALFLVGAAAGAGAAGVSYVGNDLRATKEVTVDQAWQAAESALKELQFPVMTSQKDATGGILKSRNAKDQPIKVRIIRVSDHSTEVRISVGTFYTSANRAAAQLIWDKMVAHLK